MMSPYQLLFWLTILIAYSTPLATRWVTNYELKHQVEPVPANFLALNALGCAMVLAMAILYFITKQYPNLLIIVLFACYLVSTAYLLYHLIRAKKYIKRA